MSVPKATVSGCRAVRCRVATLRRNAIYRGVLTGLNEAFIIDNETKEALVAENPRSSEILKPVLRGRDIKRYRAQWAGKWLIDTHNGHDDVPPIEVDDYPAVKAHLDQHYEKLARRHDKGITPYHLRNCAYHAEFARTKLLWIELAERGRFVYDEGGLYPEATAFLMTGSPLKFLCSVLNSKLASWYLRQSAPTSGMGTLRWKKVYVEAIPVPVISSANQLAFARLVDDIFVRLSSDADAKDLELKIDGLVSELYGLTEEEVSAVELSFI